MINEKFLDRICISNDCPRPEDWKIVATEDELSDLVRLARLGLWAEQQAKPALEEIRDEDFRGNRPASATKAFNALAAYPTKPEPLDEEAQ